MGGIMFARIRKAVVAGILAGLATGFGALVVGGALTRDQIGKALGAGLAAAITAAWATYKVRNVGTVNGSDPASGTRLAR
jgi:hypothetical protein